MDKGIQLEPQIEKRGSGHNKQTERLRLIGTVEMFERQFGVVIGSTFGRWTVIEAGLQKKDGKKLMPACRVRCACGKEGIRLRRRLRNGRSQSCGCFKRGIKVEDTHWRKLLASLKHNAKNRNLSCDFTLERLKAIAKLDCAYCCSPPRNRARIAVTTYDAQGVNIGRLQGEPIEYSGIDRVDSGRGYERGNVVPCCIFCNRAKSDYPLNVFIEYAQRFGSRLTEADVWEKAERIGELLWPTSASPVGG